MYIVFSLQGRRKLFYGGGGGGGGGEGGRWVKMLALEQFQNHEIWTKI